jgi:N-acyl-D-aspartate/D-glutamate deacylase
MAAMGSEDEDGERTIPTDDEFITMKRMLDDSMAQGTWGFTTGLHYPPGRNATADEIIELARVVAKYNGTYMSHIRGYTSLGGMQEFLDIAEKAPVRGVISHNSGRWRTEKKRLEGATAEEKLLIFDKARARGVEVYMDVLPWGGSGSFSMSTILLWEDLESKFDENGRHRSLNCFMEMLRNPEKREEIEKKARQKHERFVKKIEEATNTKVRYGDVFIVNRSLRFPEYVGRSLAEVSTACAFGRSTSR